MTIEKIFNGISYNGVLPQGEVLLVTQDSRKVQKGSIFVCTKGITTDGHDYAKKALVAGAALVVVERSLGIDGEILVEDGKKAYANLSQNFFDRPAEKLKLIAVTGTNGKTTVTSVIKQIIETAGHKCGLIGTIQSEIGEMCLPSKYTTPEAFDLNMLLNRMYMAGCEYVVMEASSQALHQHRLYGIKFDTGVFTNLSQDHLDYHGTMENYFQAKTILFENCKNVIINFDDMYGKRLVEMFKSKKVITYSDDDDNADYTARNIKFTVGGVRFAMVAKGSIQRISFPMPGGFSVSNALAAAVSAITLGMPVEKISFALENCTGVKGRSEILYDRDFTIICDFAHTEDGIEKILSSIKPFTENRLIALYGCSGERDVGKRPLMSQAVIKYADIAVLTSDNPRKENPYDIMKDAEGVLKKSGKTYYTQVERRTAVEQALNLLQAGDVLVLCGKGHEDYQVIDGVTIYLDEHEIVRKWLIRNNKIY